MMICYLNETMLDRFVHVAVIIAKIAPFAVSRRCHFAVFGSSAAAKPDGAFRRVRPDPCGSGSSENEAQAP